MAKIMLVEDDNNLREIYAARLQAEGYNVVSAKDGEEALVIAKSEKPDLIISDIMMPKISGFEMLDILRNTDGLRDVKIIMLTALGQSDDEQRANRLGADRYLVKSQVTLEDIVKVCKDLLSGEGAVPAVPPQAPPATTATTPPSSVPPTPATPPAAAAVATSPTVAAPVATTTAVRQDTIKADNAASTDAQETAAAEAEVESFVAGATTDAPAPSVPPTPPVGGAAPAPSSSVATTQSTSDQLLSDAANTLAANTQPTPSETPGGSDQSQRKKNIITPIDSQPKKDLASLLAQEEAKEAAAAIANAAGTPTPPAAPSNPAAAASDPNNITL